MQAALHDDSRDIRLVDDRARPPLLCPFFTCPYVLDGGFGFFLSGTHDIVQVELFLLEINYPERLSLGNRIIQDRST